VCGKMHFVDVYPYERSFSFLFLTILSRFEEKISKNKEKKRPAKASLSERFYDFCRIRASFSADSTVCFNSMEIVTGPTPPGTGVMALAFS
jgi:hypothetical protein